MAKKYFFISFLVFFLASCSSKKFLREDQSIVKQVKIEGVEDKLRDEVINYVQKDIKPRSPFSFSVPVYNFFNTENGRYKTSNIRAFGKPPAILDSTLVEFSRKQIESFLQTKGYLSASVDSSIQVKEKNAKVLFTAKPGARARTGDFKTNISNPEIRSLYDQESPAYIHFLRGRPYDADSLAYFREQLYRSMRENGFYDFLRQYVNFDVIETDSLSVVDLRLNISDPASGALRKSYIGTTHIIIAPEPEGFPDSVQSKLAKDTINGIIYSDLGNRFRRQAIERYDFLKNKAQFDVRNEERTYNRLYELNVFKNVKIEYYRRDSTATQLNPIIMLIPQKVMGNRIEGEVSFNGGTSGFSIGNTFSHNNIFGGAERFELQVKGGLQSRIRHGLPLFTDIYQSDFSASSNVNIPRLVIPFYNPSLGSNGMPRTIFSASYVYSLQHDVATRNILIGSVTYNWNETMFKQHSFSPINLEYRFGQLDPNIDLGKVLENLLYTSLLGRKDITLGMKYAYILNAGKLNQLRTFVYLRAGADVAGNTLYLISRLKGIKKDPRVVKDSVLLTRDYGTFLGVPYNQFVRPEIDIRWYKFLGGTRQLVLRANMGMGFAYGNSVFMNFENRFFAGGSTGIRAWQARTLGPGNYNRGSLDGDTLRRAIFGLDQLGDLKLETNVEYRGLLTRNFFGGVLKGAAFLDSGNIWNLNDDNGSEKNFRMKKFFKQLAIGTGMGLRYDLQYFVFRFDVGLKFKDPQFSGSDQWVIKKFLSGGRAFRKEYDATHGPDTYRFLQYNFGIGMPF